MTQVRSSLLTLIVITLALLTIVPSTAHGATNLIQNPSLDTVGTNGPASWSRGSWGSLTATFTYPVPGHTSGNAAKLSVTNFVNGDAKWYFTEVPVTGGSEYTFTNWSLSSENTLVVAQYRNQSGVLSYSVLGTVTGVGTWKQFTKKFTVPTGVVGMTIFHLLSQNGTLTVDDYSLVSEGGGTPGTFAEGMVTFAFDDGFRNTYEVGLPILDAAGIKSTQAIITKSFTDPNYVTAAETVDMWRRGHEIASHTRTHAHLTTLTGTKLTNQVKGSRTDLLALGITPIETIIYPYGEYDANVIGAAEKAGYTGARSVQTGFNTPTTNKWELKDQHITSNVTFTKVKGWIDQAISKKQWVILELHQQNKNGGTYSNDPALLQQIVNYVESKGVKTVTIGEGIDMLAQ